VKEELTPLFGTEIRTASQYLSLLKDIKRGNPEIVPGLVFIDYASFNTVLDLFLPECGYWSPAAATPFFFRTGTNEAVPVFILDEAAYAVEEMACWQRQGLVDLYFPKFADGILKEPKINDYPTVLLYADQIMNIEESWQNQVRESPIRSFDARGYRMYILYNDSQPALDTDFELSNYLAVAGKNSDLTEFFRFLHWLYEPANYITFFYGQEGVDFKWANGRMELLSGKTNRLTIREALSPFKNGSLEPVPLFAPGNYEEELAAVHHPYTVSFIPEVEWLHHMVYINYDFWPDDITIKSLLNNYIWHLHDVFDLAPHTQGYYERFPLPDMDEVHEIIEGYIHKQQAFKQEYTYLVTAISNVKKR